MDIHRENMQRVPSEKQLFYRGLVDAEMRILRRSSPRITKRFPSKKERSHTTTEKQIRKMQCLKDIWLVDEHSSREAF